MALTLEDLLDGVRSSRRHLLKHLTGITDDQWTWKPYPECKSIRDTLVHLWAVDRSALQSLETGSSPDFLTMTIAVATEAESLDNDALLASLTESHAKLLGFFAERYADAPLDTEVSLWGDPGKLARHVNYLSSEDFYHAGQIGYIRLATDPAWNYYAAIYS